MKKPSRTIESMKDLMAMVQEVIRDLNSDPHITVAALANPVLALEKLGYSLSPQFKREAELKLRFSDDKAKKLSKLQQAVFRAAGESFNLDSPGELGRVLRKFIKKKDVQLVQQTPRMSWGSPVEDLLKQHINAHPMMKPLLEYRALEASEPRLASEEMFEEILEGKRKLPVRLTKVKFRFQKRKSKTDIG